MRRGNQWYLRGVVSFGIEKRVNRNGKSVSMCDENFSSLYADITSEIEWIMETLRTRHEPDTVCDNITSSSDEIYNWMIPLLFVALGCAIFVVAVLATARCFSKNVVIFVEPQVVMQELDLNPDHPPETHVETSEISSQC